jgi:hypothetical protein
MPNITGGMSLNGRMQKSRTQMKKPLKPRGRHLGYFP